MLDFTIDLFYLYLNKKKEFAHFYFYDLTVYLTLKSNAYQYCYSQEHYIPVKVQSRIQRGDKGCSSLQLLLFRVVLANIFHLFGSFLSPLTAVCGYEPGQVLTQRITSSLIKYTTDQIKITLQKSFHEIMKTIPCDF